MKTLNEIIETHFHKELSPEIFLKVLKVFLSRAGVYKALKRFIETVSCLTKPRSNPERDVRTKWLIKNNRDDDKLFSVQTIYNS